MQINWSLVLPVVVIALQAVIAIVQFLIAKQVKTVVVEIRQIRPTIKNLSEQGNGPIGTTR